MCGVWGRVPAGQHHLPIPVVIFINKPLICLQELLHRAWRVKGYLRQMLQDRLWRQVVGRRGLRRERGQRMARSMLYVRELSCRHLEDSIGRLAGPADVCGMFREPSQTWSTVDSRDDPRETGYSICEYDA